MYTTPGFKPGPGDELTTRTLTVFFGVLEQLLRVGVTTVAEAAFRDRLWRPGLEPLRELAQLRIVHCTVDPDVALERTLRRRRENSVRRAHADPRPQAAAAHNEFDRVSVDVPWIEVDTTDGYTPELDTVVAFVNSGRS